VETKYDSLSGGWCSKEVICPFGVGAWQYIYGGVEIVFKICKILAGCWVKDQALA
jgi:hypothetical protein